MRDVVTVPLQWLDATFQELFVSVMKTVLYLECRSLHMASAIHGLANVRTQLSVLPATSRLVQCASILMIAKVVTTDHRTVRR